MEGPSEGSRARSWRVLSASLLPELTAQNRYMGGLWLTVWLQVQKLFSF